jgi:catechol 2,3-dioxygenase-like lactoylglutathione lyase family enzyme
MKPYLFVIKSTKLEECLSFYQSLGMELKEESHEAGTVHYSTKFDGVVWELYPTTKDELPSNNRLGFQLTDKQLADKSILAFIEEHASSAHDFGNGQHYVVMNDPDGRAVELVYQQK